MDFVRWGAAVT